MTDFDDLGHFHHELKALLLRWSLESDVSVADVIGALELEKHRLINQALEKENK